MDTVTILLSAFLISVTGLLVFIWSLRKGLLERDASGARSIFTTGEIGRAEEPAASPVALAALQHVVAQASSTTPHPDRAELLSRLEADRSSALPTLIFLCCSVAWLLLASFAGLTSSLKLHYPDWLTETAWLTFGRIRTLHLNIVAYGWAPMASFGIATWMLPRLLKTKLVGGNFSMLGALLWNVGLIAGLVCIGSGINDGMEWLEIPWQVSLAIVVGGAMIGLPLILTLKQRTVRHLYVSIWYMGAALFWFPILYIVAKLPGLHFGVEQATMNWWFGHNVLGLFYTPMALATVYYFLPKVIGRPIQSYNLSLLGFWSLAFFYGQVGGHHLIGGPVPEWMVTLSIVQSMMMLVPVLAFTTNQYLTLRGYLAAIPHSPTLRFIALGGLMYTLSSVQGSFEALRSVNTITHFTHVTVAHAHLGLYGFVTMVMFGAIYFVMPRIMAWEWPYPKLIAWHFWLVVVGFAIYFISLTIAGVLQGLAMVDASRPFMDSVAVTLPYLAGRSVGGALMTAGHLAFAFHFVTMLLRRGPQRVGAAVLKSPIAA